jgi:nicotinate-nucleotide pyrophosphorylase (carboxylating)
VFRQEGAPGLQALVLEGQWRDDVPKDVAYIKARAHAVLAGERTALNLVAHLSGIATLTARFVSAVDGSGVTILDTRKTTPGLRALEKEAVRAGGGRNHRLGLHDAVLIKENHTVLAGGVGQAVRRAIRAHPDGRVQVECRTENDVREALEAGAESLLLDNMDANMLRSAVEARNASRSSARVEASGGITLDNVEQVAETGVDFISVGALTHSAPALDLSLLVEPA